MLYFKVIMASASMCGFDTNGYFAAESEDDLENLQTFKNFRAEMQDYVDGWVDEDDEDEEANFVTEMYEEISEEEYRYAITEFFDGSEDHPFNCG